MTERIERPSGRAGYRNVLTVFGPDRETLSSSAIVRSSALPTATTRRLLQQLLSDPFTAGRPGRANPTAARRDAARFLDEWS